MKMNLSKFVAYFAALGLGIGIAGSAFGAESLQDVMKRRNLTDKDLLHAAMTFTPTGGRDEYLVFSSSGHAGQIIVYGVPSMRILKYIGVFTPEPWQGYGFDDESKKVMKGGEFEGRELTWGDTHIRLCPRPMAIPMASICSSTTRPIRASPSSA